MIAMATVPAVVTMAAVTVWCSGVVAHRRVVMIHRSRSRVTIVRGVIGVFVGLAHRNSLLNAPGASRKPSDATQTLLVARV
ncbi:hypothetical protein RS83_01611 [Microbacterium oxydans]|uniref:Uncharacterized protein n=1 Tax=Microbacterium oxydans TaxID=82380 RepID=A0A0F0LA88_9MICO|nr:hypothetical protein RS83_01611 [Microbacterium oxydans]